MNTAIRTSKVSHAFAGRPVLKKLSFSVGKGEFFIIIGPNGSGKTTLLKIFAGLLRPPRGQVEIFGRPIRSYRQKSLARTIAMVPQQLPLDFPFTVAEAILMGRAPYHGALGIERETDFTIAKQAMAFTEVEHLSDRRLDQLSGGEQQRVFIARAICQQPQIMLLDEPTASLDLAHQVRIMDLMEKLKAEKEVTVIMVSHDLNIAAMYADQLLLLKAGEIISIGLPQEVLSFGNLEASYGCRLLVDESPLGDFPRITLVPGKYLDNH
jgi:iron complex transport system ATP-binding protein